MWHVIATCLLLVALFACNPQEETPPPPGDVAIQMVPWEGQEEARYRLLRGDRTVGQASIAIVHQGRTIEVRQEFIDSQSRFRDEVRATLDATYFKPLAVERALTGPGGERRWRVQYGDGKVTVTQESDNDSRTDSLTVGTSYYDSWGDIALWRTLPLDYGYQAAYVDVGTAILRKPAAAIMHLKVVTKEPITVPAGTFLAWRLEAESKGETQTAWIADTARRELVRYDNGTYIFELEELH